MMDENAESIPIYSKYSIYSKIWYWEIVRAADFECNLKFWKLKTVRSDRAGQCKSSQDYHRQNREKSGERVKKSGISKFAHNLLKLLLFQVVVVIF